MLVEEVTYHGLEQRRRKLVDKCHQTDLGEIKSQVTFKNRVEGCYDSLKYIVAAVSCTQTQEQSQRHIVQLSF